MSGASAARLREKHDGSMGDLANDSQRDAVRLWLRLLSCTMVIEKRVKRGLVDQFATTLPRFDILAALDRAENGMSMGALGRALLVSNGNVTGLVQTLIRDGDVTMAAAPGDRRTAIVSITASGSARFKAMATAHHSWISEMFEGLEAQDQDAMMHHLDRLKRSIMAAPNPDDAA